MLKFDFSFLLDLHPFCLWRNFPRTKTKFEVLYQTQIQSALIFFIFSTMNSAPPPSSDHHIHSRKPAVADTVRDVALWRRKILSTMVLLVATATYVLLEVYQFNFLTVASWVAMFLVTLLFLWGNVHRVLGKELHDMSGMEMSEKTAIEMAYTVRELIEESIRWMLRVGAERDWFGFTMTVAFLWLISFVASRFDALTFLYTGVVLGMTVPVIYLKYEHKIKGYGWRLKMQSRRCLGAIEERLKKLRSRVVGQEMKEKKTE